MKDVSIITLLALACLSSCGLMSGSDKEPERPKLAYTPPAGIVDKVDKAAGYVFIRRYGSLKLTENDVLESQGDGRTANLAPSGEKLGERIAADIRSGDVAVGDVVYVRRSQLEIEPDTFKPEPISQSE